MLLYLPPVDGLVHDIYRWMGAAIILAVASTGSVAAGQTATTGTFVLNKFAKEIGSETYSIEAKEANLYSHFPLPLYRSGPQGTSGDHIHCGDCRHGAAIVCC